MPKKIKAHKGFTLIELMVVIAIIGILAAMAIPTFMTFIAKARRTELLLGLSGIYVVEIAYYTNHDVFKAGSMDCGSGYDPNFSIGGDFNLSETTQFYLGFCVDALPTTFTACGEGNIDGDPTLDNACVDDSDKNPVIIVDDIVT